MDRTEIEEQIRSIAKNTDGLIKKLDTLTARIDTAKKNENEELVEYYERQFAETSVEFMDGVESILDDWYLLRGEERPPAEDERLLPEDLDAIHSAVVNIVQGLPVSPVIPARRGEPAETPMQGEIPAERESGPRGPKGPKHRVDITG